VQWWAYTDDLYAAPDTTAAEGYAFLASAQALVDGATWLQDDQWTAQNFPCPDALYLLLRNPLDFRAAFVQRVNTYNDSGRVADHALDLLQMLRYERGPAGKLSNYRQVNFITHSKGSLDLRAMLDIAAGSSRQDAEFVANVVYNAPPFAGSSVAPIAMILFEDPVLTGEDIFASPWFVNSYGQLVGETVGTIVEIMLNDLLRLEDIGITLDSLRTLLPPNVLIDLDIASLSNYEVDNTAFWTAFSTTDLADDLATMIWLLRPFFSSFWGFPASPGLHDLTPTSLHIDQYDNTGYAMQFITYGRGGTDTTLFPCEPGGTFDDPTLPCAEDIVANPDVLHEDVSALVRNQDDTVVAVGSTVLPATTDGFGPRMQVLTSGNVTHGDMMADPTLFGREWLEVFLSPTTTLKLDGLIEVASAQARSYVVSEATTFSFSSPPWTVKASEYWDTFEVHAASHQYRVAWAGGSGAEPEAWVSLPLDQAVDFASLQDSYDLQNRPFYLEWRAINERGAYEMIRSARFVIEPDAPQVVNQEILGLLNEIHVVDPGAGDITPADWVIANPSNKVYLGLFDHSGHVEYAWDDPDFGNTTVERDRNALFLPLSGLSEGTHTLFFETFNDLDDRSPRQSVTFLVDNTPPQLAFQYETDHVLGYIAGPQTPLTFSVLDDGAPGQGTITVPNHPDSPLPNDTIFGLGETDLAELGRQAGQVGGFVTLTAQGSDRVDNTATQEIEVYYDWTAPEISLTGINDTLPTSFGYRTFSDTVRITVDVDERGAAGLQPVRAQTITANDDHYVSLTFVQGGNGSFPDHYAGTVNLAPGLNTIIIVAQDTVGNVNTLEVQIEYSQVAFDQEPLQVLTPRLDITCYNAGGDPVSCTPGTISGWEPSFYGDVFVFSSSGRSLVEGDTNNREDVFVWRNGSVTLASTTVSGTQANGISNRPTVSGDGRYVYFRSNATNLVSGTQDSRYNLYVKDLETGKIDVISRDSSGNPANTGGVASYFKTDATYDGRYVFFESNYNDHISGVSDTNIALDVFMVDLDPDGDGDYFDDNAVTYAISTVPAGTQTGDGLSHRPDVSQDGRYVAFATTATDLHPMLATNGSTKDVVLVALGANPDGSLDPGTRTVVPINTNVSNGSQMTTFGADSPRVGPLNDSVVFTTRSNVLGTGDTNNEALGQDVYISLGAGLGGTLTSRSIVWVSQANGAGGPQSSENVNTPFASLSVALDPHATSTNLGAKVGWVSVHDNIEPGDTNGVADMFIRRDSAPYPADLPVINWLDTAQPSPVAVTDGGLSPDGRYAYWVTTQTFVAPYDTGAPSVYRRRIEPVEEYTLTVNTIGSGSVTREPQGVELGGAVTREPQGGELGESFVYSDTDRVTLTAVPDTGWRFVGWAGVDTAVGSNATVAIHHTRAISATFEQMNAPLTATLRITTSEDTESTGGLPAVVDPDPEDKHTFSVVAQPQHGTASVRNNRVFYQPDPDFNGTDSFTIQATDAFGLMLPTAATVPVTVQAANDPPRMASASGSTGEGGSVLLTPSVDDPDVDDDFTLEIVVPPVHGTATVTGGRVYASRNYASRNSAALVYAGRSYATGVSSQQILYTPGEGFTGSDSFTFRVTDAAGLSTIGLATVSGGDIKIFLPLVLR
jgi:hypothetical protein